MKSLIVILFVCAAMFFMAGCVGDQLIWEKFDPWTQHRTSQLKISALSGMVNKQFRALKLVIIIQEPNSIFSGSFAVADFNQSESPASATAIFDGMTNVTTGGASGVADNLTKPNK